MLGLILQLGGVALILGFTVWMLIALDDQLQPTPPDGENYLIP